MNAAPIALSESLMTAIEQGYATPVRDYHTWKHVQACLGHFHEVSWDMPREVWCALLFHDIIYEPRRADNEAKSAELAAAMLAGVAVDIACVVRLIHLTAHHAHHQKLGELHGDACQFLDIDASILGAQVEVYQAYAAEVRREYVGDAKWRDALYSVGRARFLRQMMGAQRIFLSQHFAASLTAAARSNMQREWRALPLFARVVGVG